MNVWINNFILLVLMLAASGLALALRPTYKVATYEPAIDLETIIPRAFGEWHAEKENPVPMVDPQLHTRHR